MVTDVAAPALKEEHMPITHMEHKVASDIRQDKADQRIDALETARLLDKYTNAKAAEANLWIDTQKDAWIEAVNDARSALFLADKYYFDVLSREAKPPVFEAILKALVVGLAGIQPEFAMFAVVLQLGMSGDDKLKKKREKTLEGFKEISKEVIEAARTAMEAGEKLEAAESALDSEIPFLEEQIDNLHDAACHINALAAALKGAFIGVEQQDVIKCLNFVKKTWTEAIGIARPYERGSAERLARLFLYDMLREHCRCKVPLCLRVGSIKVRISTAKARSSQNSAIEFEGLEKEKREVMYRYFEKLKLSGSRPKIANWKDLLLGWEFAS
jgi:hypothetical protein